MGFVNLSHFYVIIIIIIIILNIIVIIIIIIIIIISFVFNIVIKFAKFHGCFTGSFEREVLKHFETIVERSLPVDKVTNYYQQCPGSGKQLILDYVTFFEERKMVGAPWTTFNVMTMQ